MSAPATTPPTSGEPAQPRPSALRWQGVLGSLRARPFTAICILLLSAGVIGVAGWFILYPQLATQYHLKQARRAADEYEFVAARQHLSRCLELSPKSGETHFLVARTCRRAGDLMTARQHLQKAKDCDWDRDDLELEFMLVQAASGTIRVVERNLQEFVGSGHRDEVYVLEALVKAYYESNFLDDAHLWAQYWIDHHPQMWQPQYLRGLVLERGLKPQRAMEQYEQLLSWKPDQWESRLQLGRIYTRARRYEEAKQQFESYLRGRPGDAAGTVGLAQCKRQLQEGESALALLDSLLAAQPRFAAGHLLRGQILINDLNRPGEALEALRQADTLAPNDLETVGALALAYRQLNRLDEAKTFEGKSQALESAYRRMDQIVKQIIESDQQKQSRAEAKERNVQLRYEAGMLLLEVGRVDDGIGWLLSALQENPGHMPTREALRKHLPVDPITAPRSGSGSNSPSPAGTKS